MKFAILFGRFIGAALVECAPVLSEILSHAIRTALTDSVEDGASRDDLRSRLLRRVHDAHNLGTAGGAGSSSADATKREGLGS